MTTYGMRETSGAGEWIVSTVTRNPEGLLLLAAGVALLLRSGGGQPAKYRNAETMNQGGRRYAGRREHSQTGESIGERVGEAARRAGEYASEATDKISETARSYASSAADYADEASRAAVERSRRIAQQAQETADYVVRKQPWAVGLAGLLAGAVVAATFPSTRVERRTLRGVGERLRSAAETAGEQLMEAGMQAGGRLSDVAEERGLTSEGLKEAAREVGETFSSALGGDEAGSGQSSTRQKSGEQAGSRTETRQPRPEAQGTLGGTQSSKGSKATARSSGVSPSGGRR